MSKLKQWREIKGYTQNQLGEMLGVTGAQISRYERGLQMPCAEELIKFRGLTAGELVSDDFLDAVEQQMTQSNIERCEVAHE